MRIGIDFGTTRTIVALADRGNYPVLPVEDALGDVHEHIPSVVALVSGELVCGWEALASGAPTARSFKRLLADSRVSAQTPVSFGEQTRPLGAVLRAFAAHVAERIRRSPVLEGDEGGAPVLDVLEAVVGVPANAHSAQRLLTLDAFSSAGIRVLGLINEPSAAAFEYTHRHPRAINSKRRSLVVYDLGGGTFDASLVRIDGTEHEIVRSLGVGRLGGDDFDEQLAQLALVAAGRSGDAPGERSRARLREEARSAKERLTPQSRRLVLDVGQEDAVVPVDEFYAAVTPLVTRSIDAMRPLIGELQPGTLADTEIAGIYLVGGGSGLPLIPRVLRERFGRRVHRSPYPAASTAMAIAADPDAGYRLHDRLARGIGVFRERDSGSGVSFDALVPPGATPGEGGVIVVERRYRAAHNLGWFRFVEYSALSGVRESAGDLTPLAEVLVPFAPQLRDGRELRSVPVVPDARSPEVVETVRVDANGVASIRIALPEDGYVVERSVAVA